MAPQRWAVGGGAALGLLVLVVAGRADEAAAVKAVRKLGAEVTVDPKRPGKPVVGVSFIGTEVTDAGLKELKGLNSLQYRGLYDNRVTNAGLKELRHLKSLQVLSLDFGSWAELGGDSVQTPRNRAVHHQPWPMSLDFTTQVTDAGLKELKELKSLQSLNLHKTQVTDAGVKELKELKNLRALDLRETKVTDAGLKEVKALKNLQELRLRYTQITDAGLK